MPAQRTRIWKYRPAQVLLALATALSVTASHAGNYPDHAIRMVVPYTAGGPTDITARALAEDLSKDFGQAVIVDNRPGATGLIATRLVAKAPADGYTLLYTSLNHTVNPVLMKHPGYDPVRDFAPISRVSTSGAMLIVKADSPYRSLKDLLAAAGSGATVSYASSGIGSSAHLAGEMLETQSHARMLHVPFKGNSTAAVDVISGQVTFMFYPISGLPELLAGKRIRGLAITTAERDPRFPDVPTMKELGYSEFEDAHPWTGLLAPAGTPPAIIRKLYEAVHRSVVSGKVRLRSAATGSTLIGSTPAQFMAFIKKDSDRWQRLFSAAGIERR